MNFGERLKLIRTSRELSVDDLASATKIHSSTIKRIERRGIRPSLPTVIKLADALNVKAALLTGVTK